MKKITVRIGLVLIVMLAIWATVVAFRSEPKTIGELMASYADPGLKIKIGSPFSGSILVAKNGEIIFQDAYGASDKITKTLNTVDTKFGIGSITKQFTAMLVMQLVEANQMQLEDTIAKYLPYLPKEKANHITIHQLLVHTSGLPHYEGLPAIGVSLKTFGNSSYSPRELAELIGKTRLINEPGEAFSYSSLGYHLLGTILEEVSQKSYAELLDESIVKPLELQNTGFGSNDFVAKELSKGYVYREVYGWDWWSAENGGTTTEAPFRDQSTAYAAGGMYSTVEDLFIWSEAVKSNRLLSLELTNKMLTPDKQGQCYGWVRNWDDIIEKNINVRLFGHGGALAGNSAFIAMYDDETTIIYLSNRNNIKAEELLNQVHLRANGLKDEYKIKGYPNRSSYSEFEDDGGMSALQDYFDRLSEHSGYTVDPSHHTMKGVMKIHLEAGKHAIADSLKTAFLKTHNPGESMLNQVGYDFLNSDYPKFALEFFAENTQRYPHSSNAWDSLGEAYLTYGNYQNAIDCYTKAVEIGEKISHSSLETYKENLNAAREKLKK